MSLDMISRKGMLGAYNVHSAIPSRPSHPAFSPHYGIRQAYDLWLSHPHMHVEVLRLEKIISKQSNILKPTINEWTNPDQLQRYKQLNFPDIQFDPIDFIKYLRFQLKRRNISEFSPFLVGGAASHLLSGCSYHDVDICFHINEEEGLKAIPTIFAEYIYEQISKASPNQEWPKSCHDLNSLILNLYLRMHLIQQDREL